MIFSVFSKKMGFGVFLVHPPMASVLLSASVERCFVSRMRDFFHSELLICHELKPCCTMLSPVVRWCCVSLDVGETGGGRVIRASQGSDRVRGFPMDIVQKGWSAEVVTLSLDNFLNEDIS